MRPPPSSPTSPCICGRSPTGQATNLRSPAVWRKVSGGGSRPRPQSGACNLRMAEVWAEARVPEARVPEARVPEVMISRGYGPRSGPGSGPGSGPDLGQDLGQDLDQDLGQGGRSSWDPKSMGPQV